MSDNVVKMAVRRWNKKRLILCGLLALLVIAVLVILLFWEPLNMDSLVRSIRYGAKKNDENYGVCQFNSHSSNRFALGGGRLILGNNSGLRFYEEAGELRKDFPAVRQNPKLMTGGDLTLFYDIGSSALMAVRDGRETALEFTTDGSIFDADVSGTGTVCIAAADSGYKTVLRVYDSKQTEIFRWFSSSQFMPVCAVSPKGTDVAAVALGQRDSAFDSTLNLFRTNSEEVEQTVSLGDRLVYDLRYLDNGTLCLVCEDELRFLKANGDELGRYDLASRYLSDYDLNGDGFVLVSLNMYKAGNRCTVVTVDEDGKELGSAFVGEEILDISANGSYVAVLTTDTLTIYRKDLSVYTRTDNHWVATSVLMREDGTAILISGNSASLFIP